MKGATNEETIIINNGIRACCDEHRYAKCLCSRCKRHHHQSGIQCGCRLVGGKLVCKHQ